MKALTIKRHLRAAIGAVGLSAFIASANAAVSVSWTAPQDGSAYPCQTAVAPQGQASATGQTGGTGLDLALVIDNSGSMGGSRIAAAKTAAIGLVNALPVGTTSVSVIVFNSSAGTAQQLTALSSNKAAVIAAINGISTGGGTNIGSGIALAASELTGVRHTAGRSQQMVVLSDGSSSGNPGGSADAAMLTGVDAIHSVGIPGHNVAQMRNIADGVDNILGNGDDNGVYTAGSTAQLVALFNGTGGNLVGISHVDVTLPDGTVVANVPVDGLGNFSSPAYALAGGANTFTATAYDTNGASSSTQITLHGRCVPDGGSSLLLLGLALGGAGFVKRFSKR